MNCGEVIRVLNEYLDGELDAALLADLGEHLKKCDDCRVVVDTTRQTIQLYCNCEPLPLPASVKQRLEAALARKLGGVQS